jgi:hypothetical protein
MQNITFTKEELKIIKMCNTPEKVQDFLDSLKYNFEEDGIETYRSLRGVIKHKTAHCFEGAMSAASIMSQHGFQPLIICMEASDIDHNIFVYWNHGKVGSIAKSRQVELHGRPPIYDTYYDLVMSYYPHYYNWFTQDKSDITMRGWAIIDLNIFSTDWITSKNISFIENYLYAIPYKRLFPKNEDSFYYFRRDRTMIPI